MDNNKIASLISQIFNASQQLTALTKRPFTPDGHMVGSIGEIYGQEYYEIKLYPPSYKGHDGTWNGREVQIKVTQNKSVDLKGKSDLLLVLKINPDSTFEEIYNGDGIRPWQSLGHRKLTKAGEISISFQQLKKLNETVAPQDKILRIK